MVTGRFDWRDYDRMVELEAQNQIRVVIAEIVTGAPEWMWDKYRQARHIGRDGAETYPAVGGSSATGSAPLCLDNEDVRGRTATGRNSRVSNPDGG
ncbi:MAG: beta-galactosidase [Bryobacteraceae bacterium]